MVQMEYETYDSDDETITYNFQVGKSASMNGAFKEVRKISQGGHIAVNGRSTIGSFSHRKVHNMETQIHLLEQEAYFGVLRAFKAQSDAISWDKEGLITELRKELRVSDDEHRELLTRVNSDDIIQKIREWRQAGGNQMSRHHASQPAHDIISSPTISAPTPRKKQRTSQSSIPLSDFSSMKAAQYPSSGPAGSRQFNSYNSSVALTATTYESLIGRKVWTRWPEDNSFYEAVIKDYDPVKGQHALVYDINTTNETWEWVDLKEISPGDIRWDEEDPGLVHRERYIGRGHVYRKSQSFSSSTPATGRGRVYSKNQPRKDLLSLQNGIGKVVFDDVELLDTDDLVKEVERVFNSNTTDLAQLERAKKMLRDQEQALVDAIAKLAYVSDGESDGEQPNKQSQVMEGDEVEVV